MRGWSAPPDDRREYVPGANPVVSALTASTGEPTGERARKWVTVILEVDEKTAAVNETLAESVLVTTTFDSVPNLP